jgi:hypothetical protein
MCNIHSSTFPTDGIHFPPKGPTRSQVIQSQQLPIEVENRANPKSHKCEPPLDFYRNLTFNHSRS